MDLIDEKDDLAVAVHDLLDDAFETLLELALILRASDERAHIKGIDGLRLQVLGHAAGHYLLGYALRYGRLAHARLADQDRIVLCPSGKDLENPSDLLVPADDGIELAGRGALVEIYRKS